MAHHTLIIDCSGSSPGTLNVSSGDELTITNATDQAITITFSSPEIFNPPQGSITIAAGTSVTLVVGTPGEYSYSYACNKESDAPRSVTGTIIVSA